MNAGAKESLQSLCEELGFPGLDNELCAFVDGKEFLQLKGRVTRQEKRLTELERQLNEVLSGKRKTAEEGERDLKTEVRDWLKSVIIQCRPVMRR